MRQWKLVAALLVLVVAVLIDVLDWHSGALLDGGWGPLPGVSVRRPPPDSGLQPGTTLPAVESEQDIRMTLAPQLGSSGTAFPVAEGFWMSAKHVTDGCALLKLDGAHDRWISSVFSTSHPRSDLAVFRSPSVARPVVPADEEPAVGQEGYFMGFPLGALGAVKAQVMGSGVIRATGRYKLRERVLVWAELERSRRPGEALSGMSGGPAFDGSGRLVGVLLAASPRRGRVYSSAPASIRELLESLRIAPVADGPVPPMGPDSYRAVTLRLREDGTLRHVYCRAY